ncbi:hypothetical protein Trydic_g759 [Trypoxylus dichotomus]
MLENHFRLTEELLQSFASPSIRIQRLPTLELKEASENIIHDKDKFQVKLDVQNFAPEEITVKTIDGNAIQIEANHKKEEQGGFVSKQLIRKFILPKGHDLKDVVSNLSSDGILTVTAPRNVDHDVQETVIKITHTGPERGAENEKKLGNSTDSV